MPCLRPSHDDVRPFEIDHRIALCLGGLDTRENLQALCCECHARKTKEDRCVLKEMKRLQSIRCTAETIRKSLEDSPALTIITARVLPQVEYAPHKEAVREDRDARKRKRHHSRGEMPSRAVPLRMHPDCTKLMSKIRQKGGFDDVCSDPDDFTETISKQIRYYKHTTPGRGSDHYFYADGFEGEDLRGAAKVAKAFLARAGLPTGHVRIQSKSIQKDTQHQ